MMVFLLALLMGSSSVHPRYNLTELPNNGGYAVKIGYNARLKFIVPLRCMDDADVKNPTETTQPGLEITTTHVQFGSTAVTLYIPPGNNASPPGTLYQASILCERVAHDGKTGALFILPLDIMVSSNDEDSTRTLAFFLDGKTARGFAESEIGMLRSAEDNCLERIEAHQTSGIGSVAASMLKSFSHGKQYARFNSKDGEIGILPDQILRLGDTLFVAYRLSNLSNHHVDVSEITVQSEGGQGRAVKIDVLGDQIKQTTVPNISGVDIPTSQGIALRMVGTSGPGRVLRSVLAVDLPSNSVTTGHVMITWKLADDREIVGSIRDLRGEIW
jgi:hypothetical protein